ncbi:MAG: dihydropyrimidinase [Lachnospiraceae bacterium]|nr:dihydropyrimidinase [Lachnospiraceae bacterium]
MKRLLRGGRVVSGDGCRPADILIENGKISKIGEGLSCEDACVVSVEGKLLFPGFIDAHTHFDLHVAGTVTADDFETGTKAALRGGTTTVIDFGTQYPGETMKEGLCNWHKKADGKASCDYGFHMSITEWNEELDREIDDMIAAGVTSFKLYMTYDTQVDDKTIYQILKRLKKVHGIAGVHCENSGVIAALQEEAKAAGRMGVASHPETRPAAAEAEAISRLLRLAEIAGAPVIVVHLTSREGLKMIEEARARGQEVYVETCPQYLLMDDSLYRLPGFEGSRYVCAPPLRTPADEERLWQGLKDGEIQTISTDHCSFTLEQKTLGMDDFTKIPGGMPGVETRGILMYSEGVVKGRLDEAQMCRLLAENPARLYGLYPRKGVLAPGSDADIVVIDPSVKDIISADDQITNVDYAPFEGKEVTGRIEQVYLRGESVVEAHQVVKTGLGQYVSRGTYEDCR